MDAQVNAIRERKFKDILLLSFGSGYGELLTAVVTSLLNYYYVRTMGMSNFYFLIAQTVFAVYNALNDPFLGYYTNRRFRFTKKYGKNYPWIMIGGLLSLVAVIFVYYAPVSSQIGLVFWMIFTLCAVDTFYSVFFVNYMALVPVVLRTKKNRIRFGTYTTAIGTVGMILGFMIPEFGDISSQTGYLKPMIIGAAIGAIFLLIMRPSVKEEPALTEEMLRNTERHSFFKLLKKAIKQKNFMQYNIVYLCFQILAGTSLASLPLFLEFVLKIPIDKVNSSRTLLVIVEFVGVYVSLPIWSKLSNKHDLKYIFGACGISMVIASGIAMVATSLTMMYASFFVIGLAVGGFWSLLAPIFTDTVDELTYELGCHEEGIFIGMRNFIARLALVMQAFIFFVVRSITGLSADVMKSGNITQTMKLGIRIEMMGISIVLLLIACIVFLNKYDLVGEKLNNIRQQLDKTIN